MTNPSRSNIERREEVRRELWRAHRKSPTFALSEALRKVETWEDADSSAGDGAEIEFHAGSLIAR